MKRIPEHLRKEIIRANRKKNRLSKKLIGTTNKITDLNFNHLEVKVSREKFFDLNDMSIDYDEYAYFYDSKSKGTFNIEKIKNGKLKEYYERCFNIHPTMNPYAKKFNGNFKSILKTLEENFKREDLCAGFYLNKHYFYQAYYTINDKNEIDDVYFQCDNIFCELKEFLGEQCSIIIRINYNSLKISKVYIYPYIISEKYKKFAYYYYDTNDLDNFTEALLIF